MRNRNVAIIVGLVFIVLTVPQMFTENKFIIADFRQSDGGFGYLEQYSEWCDAGIWAQEFPQNLTTPLTQDFYIDEARSLRTLVVECNKSYQIDAIVVRHAFDSTLDKVGWYDDVGNYTDTIEYADKFMEVLNQEIYAVTKGGEFQYSLEE